jgi:hypothetical protein
MPSDLIANRNGNGAILRSGDDAAKAAARAEKAELSPTAWRPTGEMAYEEWLRVGGRLGVAGRSVGWWLGDWLRYGTARYGTKYTAALRVTGYDRQTLMNMVYVATRFEVSRRRENLSWSHHAELAGLEVCEQERWLERAIADRFSVRELRLELSCEKRQLTAARNAMCNGSEGSPDPTPERVEDERRHQSHVTEDRAPDATEPAAGARDGSGGRLVTCPHCGRPFREPAPGRDTPDRA